MAVETKRDSITVRTPLDREVEWFDGVLAEKHYLELADCRGLLAAGVEVGGKAVALLVWGPACYALKDRDQWISWSTVQRLERLKLIVQKQTLSGAGRPGRGPNRRPGDAERLGGALPSQWLERWLPARCWQKASPTRRPTPEPVIRPATGRRWGGAGHSRHRAGTPYRAQ